MEMKAEHDQQDRADSAEVDPLAGDEVEVAQHVCLVVLALGDEAVDHLLLGGARGHLLADLAPDDACEHQVGRPAEDLRADDAERHGQHAHGDGDDQSDALGPQVRHEAAERDAEVGGLLTCSAHAVAGAAAALGAVLGAFVRLDGGGLLAHAAASSALSWDSTIS